MAKVQNKKVQAARKKQASIEPKKMMKTRTPRSTTSTKKAATKPTATSSTTAKKSASATKAARPVGNSSYRKRQNQILDGKAPTRTSISPKKALEEERAAELARSRRKGTNAMKTEVRDNNNNWTMGKVTGSDRRAIWNYEQKYTK